MFKELKLKQSLRAKTPQNHS